jgi:hypothetical protein
MYHRFENFIMFVLALLLCSACIGLLVSCGGTEYNDELSENEYTIAEVKCILDHGTVLYEGTVAINKWGSWLSYRDGKVGGRVSITGTASCAKEELYTITVEE